MAKIQDLHVRIDQRTSTKLDALAAVSLRTKSDVVRILIDQATADQLGEPKRPEEAARPGPSQDRRSAPNVRRNALRTLSPRCSG